MAGGMTYTAVESTALSTAEYYGKTLVELGAELLLRFYFRPVNNF